MLFTTPKYKGFNDPIDGAPMAWNVHPSGFPIRSGDSPTLISKAQLDQASHTLFARSVVLKIPSQIEEYNRILDWIVNTPSVKAFERIRDDPSDPGAWVVWLGWTEVRGVIPSAPRV
jgi:hypothetical protein